MKQNNVRSINNKEKVIYYEPKEYDFYRNKDPKCIYHLVRWPLTAGRGKQGEFPVVVAREYYRHLGYAVLVSEPRIPNNEGFILLSYPGKRRSGDPAYRRMEAIFGSEVLAELNRQADVLKRKKTGNSGGGDPDMFVFKGSKPEDRFFVEVKHKDHFTKKQLVTFPIIEKICPVIVVRIVPMEKSQ
jgi:hypothetical protein